MQYSLAVRNAQNDAAAATVGPSPMLEIRTGEPPPNCDSPDTGILIAVGKLPQDWMTQSADAMMQRNGQWQAVGTLAAAEIPGGHFRIKQGTSCHLQGTFGPGMEMRPTGAGLIAPGQVVKIQQFFITRGNA